MRPPNWADLEDDDDDDAGLLTTYNADGTQSTTSYFEASGGKQMKRVKTIRIVQTVHKISNRINGRQNIIGFGLEMIDKKSEDYKRISVAPITTEEPLKVPRRTDLLRSDDDFEQLAKSTLTDTASQAYKRDFRELGKGFEILMAQDPDSVFTRTMDLDEQGPLHITGGDKRGAYRSSDRDEATVRVTNLSEDVQQEELEKLFSRCGGVQRCHLPKNFETDKARGYAFITYYDKKDAAVAIEKLHKKGFQNLLLTVEWSKRKEGAVAPPSGLRR